MTPDSPPDDLNYRELLVRLDERVTALAQRAERGFAQVERDVITAREAYPTMEDIAKTAASEATRAYDRAANEAKGMVGRVEQANRELSTRVELAAANADAKQDAVKETFEVQLKAAIDNLSTKIDEVGSRQTVVSAIGAVGIILGTAGLIFGLSAG
jgi:hypothetical protein